MRYLAVFVSCAALLTTAKAADPPPQGTTGASAIEYPSPTAAFKALSEKKGVQFSQDKDGWIEAYEPKAATVWAFTPSTHAAHPSVVKREVVETGGTLSLRMGVLCGSTKQICDDLVRHFEQLNDKMKKDIEAKRKRPGN
jgi:hypothetical protein